VMQCFYEVADEHGIDESRVKQFRSVVSDKLRLPETVFPDIKRQHLRFDLDGSGSLNKHEAYILVKMNLWEHRKKLAKYNSGVVIPCKSLANAGYAILRELGHGNQCNANLGQDQSGELWCIKTYDKVRMKPIEFDGMREEFEVLQHLGKHPNIAVVSEVFQDDHSYYMVQELYKGKDFTTLKQRASEANVSTTESWWRGIFRQCFQGMAHIHKHALMHGDIKESNLMLKTEDYSQPHVVIIDFGLMQTAVSDAHVLWGTPGYVAPETWETGKSYPAGDIFAMGVVIMQMLLNRIPPHHNPPRTAVLPGGIFTDGLNTLQEVGIFTRARTPPFDLLSAELPALALLARQLLEKEVRRRPCAQKVLQHAWFDVDESGFDVDGFSELFRRWFG